MTWDASADVNRFDDAVEWFHRRTVLTSDQLRGIEADAQSRSFWIGAGLQLQEVQSVFDSLEKAIEAGTSFDEWRKGVRDTLISDAHAETVFRNATQRAYNAGRWDQMSDKDILEIRPYWMFDAILDARTTKDICVPRNRTVLPANHAWWKNNWPPLHHRCRSSVRNLTEDEARQLGIATEPPVTPEREGWGKAPGEDKPWKPDPKKLDPELSKELKRKGRTRAPRKNRIAEHSAKRWREHYEAKGFQSSTETLATGRAAIERGLDMRVKDVRQTLEPIADLPGPRVLLGALRKAKANATLRELGGEIEPQLRGLAAIAGHLRSINPQRQQWTHPDLTRPDEHTVLRFYSQMLDASVVPQAQWRFIRTPDRAYCEWDTGRIFYRHQSDLVHEIGHFVEYLTDNGALDFLRLRTAGLRAEKLKELTGDDYEDNEVAIPDDLAHPYVGKIYPLRMNTTELTSMGVEWLASGYRHPGAGAGGTTFERFLLDTDHLSFTLGKLAGK